MDDMERLVRHLEEVAEEAQALRHRLDYLESHRDELRKKITDMMRGATGRLFPPTVILGPAPKARRRTSPADIQGLKQAADAVAEIGGDVDAKGLAAKLSISFDAARLRLARAAKRGLVVRVKLGKYRATTHPDAKETVAANGVAP